MIRITGSDTMVNLVEAWAEHYARIEPSVSIQVAGGGTGVGIAGFIDGIVDVAAAGRRIRPDESLRAATRHGAAPDEIVVGFDALAVYVNAANPLTNASMAMLAEIYGEHGRFERWSQLGVSVPGCPSDRIVRVSRQNNSGTYAYFREAVLGARGEYKLGSIDQSGSKDVVALVALTPCAIGFSGMAFQAPGTKALAIAAVATAPSVVPSVKAARDGSYPMARPLYLYVGTPRRGASKAFIDWVLGPAGQQIVASIGFAPVTPATGATACGRR